MMNKPPVTISPMHHRSAQRIRIECPFDEVTISRIKKIKGRLWSKTHGCWHVPYTSEAYQQLKEFFEVIVEAGFAKKNIADNVSASPVKLPKVRIEIENKYRLKAFVPIQNKNWIEKIKTIPGRAWNANEKYWSLPHVKDTWRILKAGIGMAHFEFDFQLDANIPEEYNFNKKALTQPSTRQLNQAQMDALTATHEKLELERLSYSTIKSYKNHLAGLFRFYNDLPPEEITVIQLQQYLLHLIRRKKIAESTQNQIINAVKAYWERVLKRGKEWIEIPRPKKHQLLPNVLSTEEVTTLIGMPTNIKHKFILLLIYSAGLRLGEIVNLRMRDLNVSRRSIFIRRAKGKKDRYVVLAECAVGYFHEYLKSHNPTYWLIEGQNGGQYSKRSVQNIFTKAKMASGINPFATVHTLRHSYATHCIENGYNLKLVQEALGHESVKTTERYLHIASEVLLKLQSPADRLNIATRFNNGRNG